MRRWLVLMAIVVLVAAACGGDDDATDDGDDAAATTTSPASDDGGTDDTTATTQPVSDDESAAGGDDGETSEGTGPSTATVTLGGETYEFSTEGAVVAQCLTDLFGIFSVQLPMADGGDGSIAIVALYPETDPAEVGEVNSVRVSVGDDDWVADEDDLLFESSDRLEPGMSQVDSVEIDGSTVRGTATFFRQLSVFSDGEVETVTGTFEATCGEERTS
jgi:hypothetical protein